MITDMARETLEIPVATERLLARQTPIVNAAAILRERAPRFAVLCGRGSSGHCGTYLRYLIETRLGIVVSLAAPSVITAYSRRPSMKDALFVVISQSGESPDLVAALRAARADGAVTIAIVNETHSPVAQESDLVIPVNAGPETAVAATKSVVTSLVACALLVGHSGRDQALLAAVSRMPDRLEAALTLDWNKWGGELRSARAAFVVARGYGLGPAREIALKLGETMCTPALAYSAAELRHGPRAALAGNTPVLALRQADSSSEMIDQLCCDLAAAGSNIALAGGPRSNLPWIGDDDPACDTVCMLVPAYRAIERAALEAGHDPDRPPFLNKVTRTL